VVGALATAWTAEVALAVGSWATSPDMKVVAAREVVTAGGVAAV